MKKSILSNIARFIGVLLCLSLITLNYIEPLRSIRTLKEDVYIQAGDTLTFPQLQQGIFTLFSGETSTNVSSSKDQPLSEVLDNIDEKSSNLSIKLFGVIPVKEVNVHVRKDVTLMPGGQSIGVTLHTKGALVVGLSTINTKTGQPICPAAAAGIKAGDFIEKINGIEIKDAAHLATLCNGSKNAVELSVIRGKEELIFTLSPIEDAADNQLRMGMWVRDGTAGVGTLSFYDDLSGRYAALGHAITDIDTRTNLTVRDGEILQSEVVEIVQGMQGEPGELRGAFGKSSLPLGTIEINSQYGIYGRMYSPYKNPLYPEGLPMAYPEEARIGSATILTTLNKDGIQAYECNIIKLNPQSAPAQKGMVIEITDERLLKATGGIVQGMSGSPLIQDGKLLGVVTHVFVNDPTKGYCMYAKWMMDSIE